MSQDTQLGGGRARTAGPWASPVAALLSEGPSNDASLSFLLMGLPSTWRRNWVAEVEIKEFEVHQTRVGAGV